MLAQCIEHQSRCLPYSLGEALGCPTALPGRAVGVFRGGAGNVLWWGRSGSKEALCPAGFDRDALG